MWCRLAVRISPQPLCCRRPSKVQVDQEVMLVDVKLEFFISHRVPITLRIPWEAKPPGTQTLRIPWEAKPPGTQTLRIPWEAKHP